MGSNVGAFLLALLWCFLDLGEARVKRGSIRGAAADIEYIAKFCFAAQSDDTPGRLRRVRPLRCTAILVSKLSLHADDDSAKFSYVIDIDDNSTAASSLPTESAYLKVFDAKQWRYITSNRSLSCVHSHSASDRCSCSRSGCRSCEEKLSLAVTSRMMGRELGRLNASRNTYTFLFKQKTVARWWCRSFVHALCCAAFARSARQRRGANVRMHARRRYAAIMSCAQPIPNLRSVCFDSMRKAPPAPSESFLASFLPFTSRAYSYTVTFLNPYTSHFRRAYRLITVAICRGCAAIGAPTHDCAVMKSMGCCRAARLSAFSWFQSCYLACCLAGTPSPHLVCERASVEMPSPAPTCMSTCAGASPAIRRA
jgi:hypothetical protein